MFSTFDVLARQQRGRSVIGLLLPLLYLQVWSGPFDHAGLFSPQLPTSVPLWVPQRVTNDASVRHGVEARRCRDDGGASASRPAGSSLPTPANINSPGRRAEHETRPE